MWYLDSAKICSEFINPSKSCVQHMFDDNNSTIEYPAPTLHGAHAGLESTCHPVHYIENHPRRGVICSGYGRYGHLLSCNEFTIYILYTWSHEFLNTLHLRAHFDLPWRNVEHQSICDVGKIKCLCRRRPKMHDNFHQRGASVQKPTVSIANFPDSRP